MKNLLILILTVSFGHLALAQDDPGKMIPKEAGKKNPVENSKTLVTQTGAFDHSHKLFDDVLKKFAVVKGNETFIEYGALKNDQEDLKIYLSLSAAVTKQTYNTWTREQKMSFLINYYNANVLKWVSDKYPTKSIRKTVKWYQSVFKIDMFKLFGKDASLHHLEHEVLRPTFKDPLIHFGVNCAAIHCPPLSGDAIVPGKMTEQLKAGAKKFFKNTKINKVVADKKTLELSELLYWFEEDFTQGGMTIPKFVADYITDDPKVKADIKAGKYKIKKVDYIWDLNDAK